MIYLATGLLGLLFSYVGFVFAMTGGRESARIIGVLLVIAHCCVILFSIHRARQGKEAQAATALLAPMFLVSAAQMIFHAGVRGAAMLAADPPGFAAACQSAGPRYDSLPVTPVRSIAYDWNTDQAPTFNEFGLLFGTRISSLSYSNHPYPRVIEYTERKRSSMEGRPASGPDGPYIRFPRKGPFYAVSAPSADVLVRYTLHPGEALRAAPSDQGMVRYELTVTDQRNGRLLASMRYVIDAKRGRACGLTGDKRLSERSFVLKAIGLD